MRALAAALALLAAVAAARAQAPEPPKARNIVIGTASLTGIYFPVGGSICRLVNLGRKSHGLRCGVESSSGSVENVRELREREVDLAIVQSDVQYRAVRGDAPFSAEGPYAGLRSVLSLHPEVLTAVVRKEVNARTVADLRGKRVDIGAEGSAVRGAAERLIGALGWKMQDLNVVPALDAAEQPRTLCAGRLDAYFAVVGHPAASVADTTSLCGAKLLSLRNAEVDRIVKDTPYFTTASIPAGLYNANPQETISYGVRATLVTTTDLPADVVYALVSAVFDNFQMFRKMHPALDAISAREMAKDGLSAPLHEGAARLYREKGWIR